MQKMPTSPGCCDRPTTLFGKKLHLFIFAVTLL